MHVVRLPVLPSDRVPWRTKQRALTDPDIVQTWDPDRVVSEQLLALARAHPALGFRG